MCSVHDPRVQRQLLAELNLAFKKAFEICQSAEVAEKNARELQMSQKYKVLSLLGKYRYTPRTVAMRSRDCGSETLTDKSAIANKLVDRFTLIPSPCPTVCPNMSSFTSTNFHFSELREEDVLRKLTSLDTGKATGPDRILARLLRMVAPTISMQMILPSMPVTAIQQLLVTC